MFYFRTSPHRSSPTPPRRRPSTVSINSRSGSYDGDASAARLSVDSETTSTSMMKRQKASQARATQMQALYELNCDKDLPLNTKANFKTASISLGQTMTAQQAIAAYKQTEKDFIEKAPDPLLQERERERVEREKAKCKVQLKREALVSGRSNYGRIPFGGSSQNQLTAVVTPDGQCSSSLLEVTSSPTAVILHQSSTESDKFDDVPLYRSGLICTPTSEDSQEKERLRLAVTAFSLKTGRSSYGTLFSTSSKNISYQHHAALTPSAQKYVNSNKVSPDHAHYRGIPRNKTLGDDVENYGTDENSMLSIRRTGSGGLVMLSAVSSDDKIRLNDTLHLKAQQRQIQQESAATPPSRLKLASQTPMRVLDAMKLRQQGYKASSGTLC